MSMCSPIVYIIPEDTQAAAHACFPKGHPLLRQGSNAFDSLQIGRQERVHAAADCPQLDSGTSAAG